MGVGVCRGDARERIVVFGCFIPREQRRTGEGAEKPSGRGHCSRGQSTPITSVSVRSSICTIDGELALAMLVSISEGFCLDGLLGAILFRELADILAA
jgi:hypothetical protein